MVADGSSGPSALTSAPGFFPSSLLLSFVPASSSTSSAWKQQELDNNSSFSPLPRSLLSAFFPRPPTCGCGPLRSLLVPPPEICWTGQRLRLRVRLVSTFGIFRCLLTGSSAPLFQPVVRRRRSCPSLAPVPSRGLFFPQPFQSSSYLSPHRRDPRRHRRSAGRNIKLLRKAAPPASHDNVEE